MAKHKGIGANEVSAEISFYAPYGIENNSQPWGWFKTAQEAVKGTQNLARTWDNDYVLIGHSAYPFVKCGGGCGDGSAAGVLSSNVTDGTSAAYNGFRSVLVV